MIAVACFAVAVSGTAVAIASSGSGRGQAEDSTTGTTETTTTPNSTRPRHLDGRVVAIDASAKTFDLRVRRHHQRSAVTITVTDATVYKKLPNGFASIQVRNRIKADVRLVDTALVASKVELKRGHRSSDDRAGNDERGNQDANDDNGGRDGGNSGRGGNDD
jgi:hypothetical protein